MIIGFFYYSLYNIVIHIITITIINYYFIKNPAFVYETTSVALCL